MTSSGDNYFYYGYMYGQYTRENCPRYLKQENWSKLKKAVHNIDIQTCTLKDAALRYPDGYFSRYILLDHMDWMPLSIICDEWAVFVQKARSDCRILWRSFASKQVRALFRAGRMVLMMVSWLRSRLQPPSSSSDTRTLLTHRWITYLEWIRAAHRAPQVPGHARGERRGGAQDVPRPSGHVQQVSVHCLEKDGGKRVLCGYSPRSPRPV